MPFWPINVQSLCLLYFFVWFYLIRTQAFSVFSKMSSHVATPRWDGTMRQKCPSLKQRPCEQKTAARGWLCVHSSNTSSCFLSTPFGLKKKKKRRKISLEFTSCVSLASLFVVFTCSLPHSHSQRWGFFLCEGGVSVGSFHLQPLPLFFPPSKHNRHQCTAAVLCLSKVPQTSEEKQSLPGRPVGTRGFLFCFPKSGRKRDVISPLA